MQWKQGQWIRYGGQYITNRITVGPQAGRKVFTLRALPAADSGEKFANTVGKVAGFSLHAGVAAKTHERKKLGRLCRYIASEKRLSLTASGKVCYELPPLSRKLAPRA